MAEVEFKRISKSFGAGPVLRDVSLAIRDGEFVSLLGPSGCGKTTLLRILAGLEAQDEGDVVISGHEVSDVAPKRRDVAMVFQSYALYPYMTVEENVALPLLMRRTTALQRFPVIGTMMPSMRRKRREIAAEVRAVAESLGIADYLTRRPAQLSGGQRQRVALARAMVRRPAVFLMDEPLSNLDAKMRVKARAEIADLHRRLGTTFIYVTHDQTEAMTMSDRVAVMLDGRILQVDAPQALYANPQHLSVASFIGSPEINTFDTDVGAGGEIAVGERTWPIAVGAEHGSRITLAVRPEAWSVEGEGRGCELDGIVRHVEHVGSDVFVHVETPVAAARIVARLAPSVGGELKLGSALTLFVAADKILAFAADGSRVQVVAAEDRRAGRKPFKEVVNG